jgi:ankyrin repeat protein
MSPIAYEAIREGDISRLKEAVVGFSGHCKIPDDEDHNLLTVALIHDFAPGFDYLISAGFDVNSRNSDGSTALTYCRSNDWIRKLLSYGANPALESPTTGRTSIFEQLDAGNADGLKLLLESVSENVARRLVNQRDENERTPLHYAVFFGKLEIAEILLHYGAEVNLYVTDRPTMNPLVKAVMGGYIQLVDLLIRHGADTETYRDVCIELAKFRCPEALDRFSQ